MKKADIKSNDDFFKYEEEKVDENLRMRNSALGMIEKFENREEYSHSLTERKQT